MLLPGVLTLGARDKRFGVEGPSLSLANGRNGELDVVDSHGHQIRLSALAFDARSHRDRRDAALVQSP